MSLKEALEFLVSLAKEKKKEESRGHGKGVLLGSSQCVSNIRVGVLPSLPILPVNPAESGPDFQNFLRSS